MNYQACASMGRTREAPESFATENHSYCDLATCDHQTGVHIAVVAPQPGGKVVGEEAGINSDTAESRDGSQNFYRRCEVCRPVGRFRLPPKGR